MDANELSHLIEKRVTLLKRLRELSGSQLDAIRAGRMGELMQVLSDKQGPLQELVNVTKSLRDAVDDDPAQRRWESEEHRHACQLRQKECEQMHRELLALEAESEAELQRSRSDIGQQMDRVDAGRAAANRYAANLHSGTDQPGAPGKPGGRLDLSSS